MGALYIWSVLVTYISMFWYMWAIMEWKESFSGLFEFDLY